MQSIGRPIRHQQALVTEMIEHLREPQAFGKRDAWAFHQRLVRRILLPCSNRREDSAENEIWQADYVYVNARAASRPPVSGHRKIADCGDFQATAG